jgi:hypothetical protein
MTLDIFKEEWTGIRSFCYRYTWPNRRGPSQGSYVSLPWYFCLHYSIHAGEGATYFYTSDVEKAVEQEAAVLCAHCFFGFMIGVWYDIYGRPLPPPGMACTPERAYE